MLKKDVHLGGYYVVKWHDGRPTVVCLQSESRYGGYNAVNIKTTRDVRIKSAAKLRWRVVKRADGKWHKVNDDGSEIGGAA